MCLERYGDVKNVVDYTVLSSTSISFFSTKKDGIRLQKAAIALGAILKSVESPSHIKQMKEIAKTMLTTPLNKLARMSHNLMSGYERKQDVGAAMMYPRTNDISKVKNVKTPQITMGSTFA